MMSSSYTKSTSAISFPTGEYNDKYVDLKQYVSKLEQGFSVNNIDAFIGAKDSRINNYSSFIMSDKGLLSDYFTLSSLNKDQSISLVTRLKFPTLTEAPDNYFYIFNDNVTADDAQKPIGLRTLEDVGNFQNNYFFELEALNNNLIRIKHNDGVFDYYLNYNDDKFIFYKNTDNYKDITKERLDVFRYLLDDDGYLQLFKFIDDKLQVISNIGGALKLVPMQVGKVNRNVNNLINIDYTLDQNKQFLNNSFAAYNVKNSSNLILNTERGSFDDTGQYMLVTNTNSISSNKMPINYFTLDSSRSEFNHIKRGSNMINANYGLPGNDVRDYYGLNSGNDQEAGSGKLTLLYNFYDKDVYVENGSDTYFTATSSIYPYDKLNINDTTFASNGAFSGPTPTLADKIFIKRSNTTQYDNGRYLCTWLSGGILGEPGIWVDRYYYPDKITKLQALSSDARYMASFLDSVDSLDLVVSNAVLNREKFFDKKSDAAIEPNIDIKYQRIGPADIEEIINSSSPLISAFDSIFTSKTVRGEIENICREFNGTEYTFTGKEFTRFEVHKDIDQAKSFTLSFDMYLDTNNKYGFELLGNNTNEGFGIFQDQTVTPFIHVVSGPTMYIYNTDFVQLNKVDFKTNIKQVWKRSALDDYIVATAGNLYYKVNTQGNIIKLDCGSDVIDTLATQMDHDYIDFLQSDQQVKRMDVNTMTVSAVSAAEFDVYKDELCLYDNVIQQNNTIYKLPGANTAWENNNTMFYQVSNFIVKHNTEIGPETFLTSKDRIVDFTINDDTIAIITPNRYFVFNTSGVFTTTGSISTINIPIPASDPGTTFSLSAGEFISIDWVNEYISGVQYKYPVLLARGSDAHLYLAKGTFPTLTAAPLGTVRQDINTKDIKLTNYNALNRIYDNNSIDFKLTLKNYLNSEDITNRTISFSPSAFKPGFYNFTYRLDTLQGNVSLYINGDLYDNQTIQPGKFQIQDIFQDEFFVGTTGFQSNLDLATYLKQPEYYYSKDLTIRNPFIYDRAITTQEVYALYLLNKKVDDLILSLPGGQRTSKTEIQQFFKFNRTNSSNLIDIVVRNLSITDTSVREQIKTSILAEANQFTPVGVTINDVKFINYGDS